MSSGGETHFLPAAERNERTPKPGAYILWLAGATFEWHFPRHLHLYLGLKSLEANGACVGLSGMRAPEQRTLRRLEAQNACSRIGQLGVDIQAAHL